MFTSIFLSLENVSCINEPEVPFFANESSMNPMESSEDKPPESAGNVSEIWSDTIKCLEID